MLKRGFPWEKEVFLTPLPNENKIEYLNNLIYDAIKKGSKIINYKGGYHTNNYFEPAILFPVDSSMRIFHEEQFGPIVPICTFKNTEDLIEKLELSEYGQQASVFSNKTDKKLSQFLEHQFGRINYNLLCQRGPDYLPFSVRKKSGTESLGIKNTLKYFCTEVVISNFKGTN